jgi:hypothetical protein
MLDEPGRHLRNLEHAISVERLQLEKAGFKARIEDLEAERQRLLEEKARREKEIEAEQNVLKTKLSEKEKEIERQSQLIQDQEPIVLDPEDEVFQDPEGTYTISLPADYPCFDLSFLNDVDLSFLNDVDLISDALGEADIDLSVFDMA